jgi:alanyl-tRNA synthetase
LRRALRYGRLLGITKNNWLSEISEIIVKDYSDVYPELGRNFEFIIKNIKDEQAKFEKTLERGLAELKKIAEKKLKYIENSMALLNNPTIKESDLYFNLISGKDAFYIYSTYGFPLEMIQEEISNLTDGVCLISEKEFNEELEKHQDLSRTASAGMFKGGLADASVETTKLHSAAHLLLAALRKVLGDHVTQRGSNITAERLRFDFSHGEKLTAEQIKQAEDLVNNEIRKNCLVEMKEMSLDEAKAAGAMGVFESKYGEMVKVFTMGDFSKEICGGPHVENTGTLGVFKIIKEESSSAGVRRIKAVLE